MKLTQSPDNFPKYDLFGFIDNYISLFEPNIEETYGKGYLDKFLVDFPSKYSRIDRLDSKIVICGFHYLIKEGRKSEAMDLIFGYEQVIAKSNDVQMKMMYWIFIGLTFLRAGDYMNALKYLEENFVVNGLSIYAIEGIFECIKHLGQKANDYKFHVLIKGEGIKLVDFSWIVDNYSEIIKGFGLIEKHSKNIIDVRIALDSLVGGTKNEFLIDRITSDVTSAIGVNSFKDPIIKWSDGYSKQIIRNSGGENLSEKMTILRSIALNYNADHDVITKTVESILGNDKIDEFSNEELKFIGISLMRTHNSGLAYRYFQLLLNRGKLEGWIVFGYKFYFDMFNDLKKNPLSYNIILNNLVDGIHLFERNIIYDEHSYLFYRMAGEDCLNAMDFERAKQYFNKAILLGDTKSILLLGDLYIKFTTATNDKNEINEAIKYFEENFKKTGYIDLLLHLSTLYFKANMMDQWIDTMKLREKSGDLDAVYALLHYYRITSNEVNKNIGISYVKKAIMLSNSKRKYIFNQKDELFYSDVIAKYELAKEKGDFLEELSVLRYLAIDYANPKYQVEYVRILKKYELHFLRKADKGLNLDDFNKFMDMVCFQNGLSVDNNPISYVFFEYENLVITNMIMAGLFFNPTKVTQSQQSI